MLWIILGAAGAITAYVVVGVWSDRRVALPPGGAPGSCGMASDSKS